jgi:hypothetical protein
MAAELPFLSSRLDGITGCLAARLTGNFDQSEKSSIQQ